MCSQYFHLTWLPLHLCCEGHSHTPAYHWEGSPSSLSSLSYLEVTSIKASFSALLWSTVLLFAVLAFLVFSDHFFGGIGRGVGTWNPVIWCIVALVLGLPWNFYLVSYWGRGVLLETNPVFQMISEIDWFYSLIEMDITCQQLRLLMSLEPCTAIIGLESSL